MKMLTRIEELILFSIWKLKDNAYCIPVHEEIEKLTGEKILLGSIYMPLDRLIKKEYLESWLSESTPSRGGRHKRIYSITQEGKKALAQVKQLHENMWNQSSELIIEKE